MSIKDQIRQEVERRNKELDDHNYYLDSREAASGYELALNDLLFFIDSLPEDEPSKDLEEAAEGFATQTMPFTDETYVDEGAYHGFIAGAEWGRKAMRDQMIEDAIDYKIVNNLAAYPVIYYEVNYLGLKYGDKVKIIILKEDED